MFVFCILYALFPHRFLSGVIKRPQWKTRMYTVIIYDLLQWKCGAILIPSGGDDVDSIANVDDELNSLFLLEIRYDHNGFVNKFILRLFLAYSLGMFQFNAYRPSNFLCFYLFFISKKTIASRSHRTNLSCMRLLDEATTSHTVCFPFFHCHILCISDVG